MDKINPDFIKANLGLVGLAIKGIECPPSESCDDLFNEGVLGLYDAARQYDPDKGVFTSFAVKAIRFKILNYLRKNANKPLFYLDDQNEVIDDDKWGGIDARIDLEVAIKKKLSKTEKEVINRIYYKGYTLQEIGDQMGVSHTTIARVRDKALIKMKEAV